ncbi:hypothetical protein D9M70_361780 [compost metagenome]
MTTMETTWDPIEALSNNAWFTFRLGKPFNDPEFYYDGGVFIPYSYAYRFAVMNAVRLLDQLRVVTIREEMDEYERQRKARRVREEREAQRLEAERKAEEVAREAERQAEKARSQSLMNMLIADRERNQLRAQIHPRRRKRFLEKVARVNEIIEILQPQTL